MNRTLTQNALAARPAGSGRPQLVRQVGDKRAAFSIVEMLVVLLIMSILAAAAAPTFYRSLNHHRLESAARRVKRDLEYLRDAARAQSVTLGCEFSGSGYTLDEDAIRHLDRGQAYEVDLAATPYELDSVSVDLGGDMLVTFDGYGAPSENGEIVLGLGGETRTILLEGSTGQITISEP